MKYFFPTIAVGTIMMFLSQTRSVTAFTLLRPPQTKSARLFMGIHLDETTGKCQFGRKEYWDDMYQGRGDRPADSYSWYCGFSELSPFWTELVPSKEARVLIAGIGNDPSAVDLYDAGFTNLTAFDYSAAAVDRAKVLFGIRRDVTLFQADAQELPLVDACIDATLDKGTLDAIYITGHDTFVNSVREFSRVTAPGGVVVCVSRVMEPEVLREAFDSTGLWQCIHDGGLAFAPTGEATIDLGAYLYSWRRTETPYSKR